MRDEAPADAGGGATPQAPPPAKLDPLLGLKDIPADQLPRSEKMSRRRAHRVTNERKARCIGMIADGMTVKATMAKLGLAHSTYTYWRNSDPEFKAKVDAAKYAESPARYDGSFASFRKHYFGMDSYYHHMRMVDALENAKPMAITMILTGPEHGKTTLIEDYINYKLATDPNFRITVVSERQEHAKKIISRVQKRMTDVAISEKYIIDFGPFHVDGMERKGKPWTSEYMTVYRADHDERDFSLEARGSTSAIAGTRTDLMIVDDIQSMKNYAQTKKLVETFRQDFLTRPGREGRVVIIGTRVQVGDFYEELQDQGVVDELVCLPTTDVNEPVFCPLGEGCDVPEIPHEKPLCPEMWDSHSLAKRRKQVTDPVWWRNYQQRPRLAGDATFTDKMVEDAKDHTRFVRAPSPDVDVMLGVDPALGGGSAIVAVAASSARLDIVDCVIDYGLGRTEQILERLEQFVTMYRPGIVVFETDTHQKGIARDDRLESMTQRYGFRVIEHLTRGEKADPILGVAMMAGGFSRREVSIPWGDDYAQRRMEPLVVELLGWRPDIATKKLRQDAVMALWFTWRYWMQTRRSMAMDADAWKTRGLPWAGVRREAAMVSRATFKRSA